MSVIEFIDPEHFRRTLAKNPDPEMAAALAYYDELTAQGHKAALYLEPGTMTLTVGTLTEAPTPNGVSDA